MDATKFYHQIGTVGSGNHFVEIGVTPAGNYAITVHCGSRNLGQKVWKYWHMIAHDPNFNHPSIGYLAGEAYCATPQKFSVSDFWGATQSETPLFLLHSAVIKNETISHFSKIILYLCHNQTKTATKQTNIAMKRLISVIMLCAWYVASITASEGIATISNSDEGVATQEVTTTDINKRLAARGYRGFVNYTPLIGTFINNGIAGSVSTTHGYQLHHHLFVGGGVGFHINLGDQGLGVAIPVYAAVKGNVGKRMAQLTYGARVGVSYADYGNFNSDTSVHNGQTALAYVNVSVGLRLGIARYFALHLTPELDIFAGKYHIGGVGLRLGFEF